MSTDNLKKLPILDEIESLESKLIVIREDGAETNRMCRKMYYEMLPNLSHKIDDLSSKLDTLEDLINILINRK